MNKAKIELQVWLKREGISQEEIKEVLGISKAAVSRFVSGENTSRPIACYLIGRGCPEGLVNPKTGRVTGPEQHQTAAA